MQQALPCEYLSGYAFGLLTSCLASRLLYTWRSSHCMQPICVVELGQHIIPPPSPLPRMSCPPPWPITTILLKRILFHLTYRRFLHKPPGVYCRPNHLFLELTDVINQDKLHEYHKHILPRRWHHTIS